MSRRQLEKFTNAAGQNAYEFHLHYDLEWESIQEHRTPVADVVAASYAFDLLGDGLAPKVMGTEKVRFNLIQDSGTELDIELDTVKARLRRNGRGKLWTVGGNEDRRWTVARVAGTPEIRLDHLNATWAPVVVAFRRYSDWYAEAATEVGKTVTASPTAIEVTNGGTADATALVIELAANASNGFVNPRIDNVTTGEWMRVNRTAANSNHRIRIDTGKNRVEYSTDGGNTWTDDYPNLEVEGAQAGLLTLVPGINDLDYSQASGTPNVDVTVTFHAPYE